MVQELQAGWALAERAAASRHATQCLQRLLRASSFLLVAALAAAWHATRTEAALERAD
jgi:hypothetical protein